MPYLREDMADIRLTVDGKTYGDSWATLEGGDLEADTQKTRPGGMGKQVDVGGPASRSDATLSIQVTDQVIAWHKELENKVGVGSAKIGYTFLNKERTPTGDSQTIKGTVKGAHMPNLDANGNAVAFYTVVVGSDEQAA